MRFFLFLFLLFALQNETRAQAPKSFGAYFAYFKWEEIVDATNLGPDTVNINGYAGSVRGHSFVTENPAVAKEVYSVLRQLRSNGTDNISKCFIPRHYIGVTSGDTMGYEVLVCFECDGIRFSNQKKTTPVKSVAKREQLMARLKKLFVKFHFDMKE